MSSPEHHSLRHLPCLLALSTAAALAQAAPRVNDTGLTACFDSAGTALDCAGSGQDGEYGRDLTHPASRDGQGGLRLAKVCRSGETAGSGSCPSEPVLGPGPDHWGCTADRITGLLWEVKTLDGGLHDGRHSFTHSSFWYDPDHRYNKPDDASGLLNRTVTEGLCGRTDWRLPQAPELLDLAVFGALDGPSWLDRRFFPNARGRVFWAADTDHALLPGQLAELATTSAPDIGADYRTSMRPLMLVSGESGYGMFNGRFAVSADGRESFDRHTRLVWSRCVLGQVFEGKPKYRCIGTARNLTLDEAVAEAARVAKRTGQPWRLPNIKELASVMDASYLNGADQFAFPGRPQSRLLSNSVSPLYHLPYVTSNYNTGLAGFDGAVYLVRDAD